MSIAVWYNCAMNNEPVKFVYFPRSSGTFLSKNYLNMTGVEVEHSHDLNILDGLRSVVILRNPFDCILSTAIDQYIKNYDSNKTTAEYLREATNYYNDFHKTVEKHGWPVLITFEMSVFSTHATCRMLSNIFNNNYNEGVGIILADKPENTFIPTATASPAYEIFRDELSRLDLSRSFEIYSRLLKRVTYNNSDTISI